jgi:ABC-type sugar transport system ATPase subunit
VLECNASKEVAARGLEGIIVEKQPVVELKRITKNFGGVKALDNVDFEVYNNEILALVGDNGAGKSTLAKIISGVHPPDKGETFFEGKSVHIVNPRQARSLGIEMVYQDLALFNKLDVACNLFMGRELFLTGFLGRFFKFLNKKEMYKRSEQILQEIKINLDSSKKKVGNLSGGQRQAIAVGRAIFWGTKFVILDEPTSALGVKESHEVLELIKGLKENGLSIMIISHNLQHVFSVADRIIVLRGGRRVGEKEVQLTTGDEVVKLIVGAEVIA